MLQTRRKVGLDKHPANDPALHDPELGLQLGRPLAEVLTPMQGADYQRQAGWLSKGNYSGNVHGHPHGSGLGVALFWFRYYECGLTIEQVAERSGISAGVIEAIESGKASPNARVARLLSNLYGIRPMELLLIACGKA